MQQVIRITISIAAYKWQNLLNPIKPSNDKKWILFENGIKKIGDCQKQCFRLLFFLTCIQSHKITVKCLLLSISIHWHAAEASLVQYRPRCPHQLFTAIIYALYRICQCWHSQLTRTLCAVFLYKNMRFFSLCFWYVKNITQCLIHNNKSN